MKQIKKIGCLALAGILALNLAAPALAAGEPLEKSETIFTVLNSDGSSASQSVSVHLHREDGLQGAADKSSLENIQCTQGEGGFDQSGENLTWKVEGDDAYYQGESDRKAPIAAKIAYSLDGKEAPLEELLGKSGRLTITVDLTNQETGSGKIGGKDRQLCTPFATVVAAILDENCTHVQAEHGRVEKLSGSTAAGFVCLPGVKDSLEDLLPDELAGLEDYLIDQVTIEADVKDLTAPTIMLACATDARALEEDDSLKSQLEEIDGLQDDMDQLTQAMADLIDGAAQLREGTEQLQDGAGQLHEGAGQLDSGAAQLNDGTSALQAGADALSSGSISARDGASALKSGADELVNGLGTLQNGVNALAGASAQLQSGSDSLSAGLSALNGKSAELTAGAKQVSEGAASLAAALGEGSQLAAGSAAFAESLGSAAAQGAGALEQLPSPESYGAMLQAAGVPAEQQQALLAAYSAAYQTAGSLSAGLTQLNGSYSGIDGGIRQAGQGAATLQQGSASLCKGIEDYTQGVATASAGAGQLNQGIAQLGQQLPGLTSGVGNLAAGAGQLSSGAGSLRDGNAALADGAAQLYAGIGELAGGAQQLATGIQALVEGAAQLADGTVQLNSGANELEDGLRRFDKEGISKLTESLDSQQLANLRDAIDEMESRLEEYDSFSGTPENSQVSTKFIMKTATPGESKSASSEKDSAPAEEKASFWDRLLGLFGLNG